MDLESLLQSCKLILMEGSIIELLRRNSNIILHPTLLNAPLIYQKESRKALRQIYFDYLQVASEASLPILLLAPTWRASKARVEQAGVPSDINENSVKFLQSVRTEFNHASPVLIGGLTACANDCYQPTQTLTAEQAYKFHTWQIDKLAKAGVDYIQAATIPSLSEATGIAKAMSETGIPYIISFVISKAGKLLDGSELEEAINTIDDKVDIPPTGYMINCAYPTFLHADKLSGSAKSRLIGFQANASSLDHDQLDEAQELHLDPIEDWTSNMLDLNNNHGITILGGCCGTSCQHIKSLVNADDK